MPYIVTNFAFGHSYGYLDDESLWRFEEWMTESSEEYPLEGQDITIDLDWQGQLPYPEGLYIFDRIDDIDEGLQGGVR